RINQDGPRLQGGGAWAVASAARPAPWRAASAASGRDPDPRPALAGAPSAGGSAPSSAARRPALWPGGAAAADRRMATSAAAWQAPATMGHRAFTRYAWGVLGFALLAILWGYFLRISESGDGCGTDWPMCRAALDAETQSFSTLVELSPRLSSGPVLVLVLGMFVWAYRAYPRGSAVRFGATCALALTLSESLFGALLVLFGWVAGDISTGRLLIRPFHVTNTFSLMAALALTPLWASRGTARRPALSGEGLRIMWPAVLGALALAWTGAWTGLATTAFAPATLQEGLD